MLEKSSARLAALVYFVQGALGITGIALPLYLKNIGFSVSDVTYLMSLGSFPWFLKILYGAISDSVPILGMRRKPYIFLSSLISAVGWLVFSTKPTGFWGIVAVLAVINTGFAATDVITDGLIVERSTKETAGKYQSLAWGFRSLGAILSGALGGYLARAFPYHQVFAMAAVLPMATMIACFFVREHKTSFNEFPVWEPIWKSIKLLFTPAMSVFSLILIVGSLSASFNTPFFFHLKETMQIKEEILGMLMSLSWMGAIIGALIFGKFLSRFNIYKLMIAGVVINVFNVIACLLVQDVRSAVFVFLMSGILAYITFLPFLTMCAKLTHGTGVEGCLFAVFMSIHNLGTITSGLVGGKIFPLIGLQSLIVGTGILGFLAIPLILKLKKIV
ncbi:MAG: MFS transporter [Candidatus Omnitrophica bacterium]|nr:MFS transporter [Candidatus Omnitrophota bacterium]